MARLYYTAANYNAPFQHLNTQNESVLKCKKVDLYRCMITVGNPSFLTMQNIRNNGFFRAFSDSIIQKYLLVQANITRQNRDLQLHPIFNGYVLDQKRIVSYNLGMAVAKYYSEKLLQITNLIHVETLKKQNAIVFVSQVGTTKEPDLVGQTANGEWHIFEAKGMSTNSLGANITRAKNQARQISTIHGNPPATLSVCATYFSNQKILSRIEDPISNKDKKLEIDTDKYYDIYYSSFFAFEKAFNIESKKKKIENIDFRILNIERGNTKINIGLDEEVFDLVNQKNYSQLIEYYNRRRNKGSLQTRRQDTSLGLDGFFLQTK